MSRIFTLACVLAVALATAFLIIGSASANDLTGTSITCTEVSGSFVQFVKADHPIVWHVSVNGGAFQTLPTTETPPGFIGSGTATADISALTSGFAGQSVTVKAFATWTAHTSPTVTETVTCDAPPSSTTTTTTTTTIPVIVGGEIVSAPTAVVASPSFTG
ncbi:MAG TPA: hypothetical protein VFC99_01285 [Acidimicrobiia bacterium]|nr:hypothetical protein [Acidimicrobiia bacterium]